MKLLIVILLSMALVCPAGSLAQKRTKPWNEWSKQETEKILNDSPWAQTQSETDLSEMFFRLPKAPDARASTVNQDSTPDERGGATNQATTVKYRIRFLSAKPIRQAIARSIESKQTADDVVTVRAYMNDFVERNFDRWVAVTVTVEAQDQRFLGQATQVFGSAVTEVLKQNTYLERKDGKRNFLEVYQPHLGTGWALSLFFAGRLMDRRFSMSGTAK